MALTAEQLKRKSAQDAEATFEAVFQEHWRRVYALLYNLVGEGDEAEDLALETFWRLHRLPPSVIQAEGLNGWLYRVATNLGLNALRARKRRQRYEEQAGYASTLELQGSLPGDPAEEVERAQERQRVRQTLAQMKTRSAQLLVLRHSGFSYAEIAATLGIAPASVGTLLARAEREFEGRFKRLD